MFLLVKTGRSKKRVILIKTEQFYYSKKNGKGGKKIS